MRFGCDVLLNLCGNGSLKKSLATVNLLTIWDENLGTWLVSGSGATAEHRRGQHNGDEGERKQVTIGYCWLE
jgi:hypothetical protein